MQEDKPVLAHHTLACAILTTLYMARLGGVHDLGLCVQPKIMLWPPGTCITMLPRQPHADAAQLPEEEGGVECRSMHGQC